MISANELRGVPPKLQKLPGKRVFVDAEDAKLERQKEKARIRSKRARAANLERSRAIQKRYREKNKEKIAKLKAAWRKKNIAVIRKKNAARMREWREKNRELCNARERAWALAHRDYINAKRRERYAKAKSERLQAESLKAQGKASYVRRARTPQLSGNAGRQGIQHGEAAFQGACG